WGGSVGEFEECGKADPSGGEAAASQPCAAVAAEDRDQEGPGRFGRRAGGGRVPRDRGDARSVRYASVDPSEQGGPQEVAAGQEGPCRRRLAVIAASHRGNPEIRKARRSAGFLASG